VRAADLIGQLADINYLRKQTALYDEFRETGTSDTLGYSSVADLRANYPDFFWKTVRPYMGDALRAPALTEARAICDFLLEAACEATTWAAVLNAQRGPRSSASRIPFPSVTSVVATLCRRWVI